MRLLGQPSTGGRSTLRLPVHRRTAGSAGSGHAEASAWTQNSIRDVASDVESWLMLTFLCLDCVASISKQAAKRRQSSSKTTTCTHEAVQSLSNLALTATSRVAPTGHVPGVL